VSYRFRKKEVRSSEQRFVAGLRTVQPRRRACVSMPPGNAAKAPCPNTAPGDQTLRRRVDGKFPGRGGSDVPRWPVPVQRHRRATFAFDFRYSGSETLGIPSGLCLGAGTSTPIVRLRLGRPHRLGSEPIASECADEPGKCKLQGIGNDGGFGVRISNEQPLGHVTHAKNLAANVAFSKQTIRGKCCMDTRPRRGPSGPWTTLATARIEF
jgi:hypothetical protein